MAVSFILFFLFLLSWILPSTGNPRTDMVARTCREARPNNLTTFINNFLRSMEMLNSQMETGGFGMASAGEPPDGTYLMAQCHGDLSPEDCSICFCEMGSLLQGCFPAMGGRVYLDGCFIRAENYSFYSEMATAEDKGTICGLLESGEGPNFSGMVRRVMDELIEEAPSNEGYGIGSEISRHIKVFALANCWRTLDQKSCRVCLGDAAREVSSCLPTRDGRVLHAGCFIRYSDTQFFNNHNIKANQREVIAFCIYVIGLSICSVIAVIIGTCVGRFVYLRIHKSEPLEGKEIDTLIEKNLHFKYPTLQRATNFFSDSNKLGQGGFGEVYKGILKDGREIAVKRLFFNTNNQVSQVHDEINIINRAQHKNLVRLLGCSLTSLESFLIYEFVANSSLNHVLFDTEKKKELDWKKRLGIIIGVAEGLKYLHNGCEVSIVHRDIKASNILLDLKYRPKIADFGLARFCGDGRRNRNAIAGTLGYIAPEYITHGHLTEKVDVYSYGVLILEIISGVKNNRLKSEESTDTLVTYAWKHFQSNTVSEVVDKSIEMGEKAEAARVAQVGLLCTQESPSLRPSMAEIIKFLRQKDLQLPTPSKPPFVDEYMELSAASDAGFCQLQSSISSSHHFMDF